MRRWLHWTYFSLQIGLLSTAALATTITQGTVVIRDDPGGRIDKSLQQFTKLRHSGAYVVLDGTCNSACTVLLGIIPRSRICVTERANLGFHSAWVFDRYGGQVESPIWTNVLWHNYPRDVRDWIKRNGGLTPRMIFLRGDELRSMVKACHT